MAIEFHRMGNADDALQSPCLRRCCLDDHGTCLGCFRSLDEIKEWGGADNRRRQAILRSAALRREARAVPREFSAVIKAV
jgi:predicted Fe-S protein YdhL (DUF1289 family)